MDYELDSIDRKILRFMQEDSRTPFLEIARRIKVSGGTIHARVNRLKELGVIQGTVVKLDPKKLGLGLSVFVGIDVDQANYFRQVASELAKIKEVLEIHYTTGEYALFIKIAVRDTTHLHVLLTESIQSIEHIRSTHTIVILNTFTERSITP